MSRTTNRKQGLYTKHLSFRDKINIVSLKVDQDHGQGHKVIDLDVSRKGINGLARTLLNQLNQTHGVAVVTPTDRPKSVRNRCEIEVFVPLFVFSRCFWDFSVGVGAFVIGPSQISSFFAYKISALYLM